MAKDEIVNSHIAESRAKIDKAVPQTIDSENRIDRAQRALERSRRLLEQSRVPPEPVQRSASGRTQPPATPSAKPPAKRGRR